MKRHWIAALLLVLVPCILIAQDPQYRELPEEDEDLVQHTDYAFNPIQAEKEVKVGDFYWKKKSYRAAAGRYEEATKWNPRLAEAWWKLGLAKDRQAEEEKTPTDAATARHDAADAFRKYLDLSPKGKEAKEARERIEKIESAALEVPPAKEPPPVAATPTPSEP